MKLPRLLLRATGAVIVSLLLVSPRPPASAQDQPDDKQLAALRERAQQARVHRDAAKASLEARQKELKEIFEKLTRAQADHAEAERSLKPLEETLKKQQAAVKAGLEAKQKADAALAAAKKDAEAANKALAQAQAKAKDLRERLDAAVKSATDARGKSNEKAELDKLTSAATALAAQLNAAARAHEAANKQAEMLKTANAAAEKAARELSAAQAPLKATEEKIAAARATIEKSSAEIEKLAADLAVRRPVAEKAREVLAGARVEWLGHEKAYERALADAGKLVLFSEKIAPIFAQRCLACHNARTAKGRLNLETYASLMKGGESGAAVEPGDGEFSTLFLMVEDGTMPKEADPLTSEQLAVIKKWIDTGAKLDAGCQPDAPLITILPKLPQPDPPEKYRVPMPVTALAFSPDGKLLASSGYHEVLLWNAADGKLKRRITNVAERVYDIDFSADGKTIAVAAGTPGQLGEVKLFGVADGKLIADLVRTGDAMFAVAFSPDGRRLACGGADRAIRVFDLQSRNELVTIEDHADWVMDVAWSPDGARLASASRDKTSKVFDMTPPKEPANLTAASPASLLEPPREIAGDSLTTFNSHGEPVFAVAFAPDGKSVVTAGADKQLRVWNPETGKEIRKIGGFGQEINDIRVTADGRVFSSSADKTARVHTLADGKQVKAYGGHADWLYALAVHPATKQLATGGYDGEVRLWNIEEGKTVARFTAAPGYTPPVAQAAKE